MNNITDLIQDALSEDDYELRINFLIAGLISEEANDTKEKEMRNIEYLKDITEFAKVYKGNNEKVRFLERAASRIQEYLGFSPVSD